MTNSLFNKLYQSDNFKDFLRLWKRPDRFSGDGGEIATFSNNSFLRYFSFTFLYFAQGIPQGYLYLAIPAWMATHDFTPYEIGQFMAVSFLPWSFKILVAPVMDRFIYLPMGRRRPWLLFGQIGIIFGMLLMSGMKNPESSLGMLIFMGFLINFFTIVQDIAIDGLAIDVLPEDQQARANGLMWGAKTIGVSVTVAMTSWLFNAIGFSQALWVFAAMVALGLCFPLLIREVPGEKRFLWNKVYSLPESRKKKTMGGKKVAKKLFKIFILPASILLGISTFSYSIVEGITDAAMPVIAVQELAWPEDQYSNILAIAQLVGGLLGMFVGGVLIDFIGKRKMTFIYFISLMVISALFALLKFYWSNVPFVTAFIFLYCMFRTFINISIFALAMRLCWKQMAATHFTIYMVLMNLGMSLGSYLMGVFEQWMDWEFVFIVNIVILSIGLMTVKVIKLEKYDSDLNDLVS